MCHRMVVGLLLLSGNSDEQHPMQTKAFAVDGSGSTLLCFGYCILSWDRTGESVFLDVQKGEEGSSVVPVLRDSGLPKITPAEIDDQCEVQTRDSVDCAIRRKYVHVRLHA